MNGSLPIVSSFAFCSGIGVPQNANCLIENEIRHSPTAW